jgi:hypothetical protein
MFLIIGCAGALIIAAITMNAARKAAKQPNGRHMPLTNPYRIGAYVLITEDLQRPDMSFYGTVLSMAGGMCTVREAAAPYAPVTVPREYVYPGATIL